MGRNSNTLARLLFGFGIACVAAGIVKGDYALSIVGGLMLGMGAALWSDK